jgi:hypothetical protein
MRLPTVVLLALTSSTIAPAQTLMRPVSLLHSDAAVLESREARKDLRCAVKPIAPELGFDLTYHSGFAVAIPLRELTRGGNLTSVFGITPTDTHEEAAYFTQKWSVPPIDEDAKGEVELRGSFVLGEGSYHVKWMVRDQAERYCSAQWQVTVERRGKDRQVQLRVPPGAVGPEDSDLFAPEPPVDRSDRGLLRVLVFLHYAPHAPGGAAVRSDEAGALLAMLRRVAREPRIGQYSLLVFNLAGGETLFRQRRTDAIDFPALGYAVERLNLGTVTVEKLAQSHTETNFLSALLADEIAEGVPDGVIFIGPKMTTESSGWERSLRTLGDLAVPTFYLSYDAHPYSHPWRDLIGSAVRFWKGSEYTIARPRDLTAAWASVMANLAEGNSRAGVRQQPANGNPLLPKK